MRGSVRLAGALGAALVLATTVARTAPADTPAGSTSAGEATIGYSNLRQNADAAEPGLTSLAVEQTGFGRLWDATVPGTTAATPNQVYAQPLVVAASARQPGHVVVATEENEVVAYDPASGRQQWAVNLGPSWTPTPTCGDLSPHIGITSTPVYDPSRRTVYLIAKSADGPGGQPTIKVHALDVDTGVEPTGWPLTIQGTSTNGHRVFNPSTSNQRPGLLLGDDGAVYFAMASHCDNGPFVGFVGRVGPGSTAAPAPTLSLWTTVQNNADGQAGIWQSGGGIMSDGDDANGHPKLFVATGNGVQSAPGPGPGTSPPDQLSESLVRLKVNADGSMSAADFFSPTNNARLDLDDSDLSSGAPVALPDDYGSSAHPHLLVIAGKDGVIRLLDRDNLGGMGQAPGGGDADVSSTPGRGVWGHAAVFDAGPGRHYLYLAPAEAPMQVLSVAPDANGVPTVTQAAATSEIVHFGSGSPIVTSDGGDPSTALVWELEGDGSSGANGRLVAYPAVPAADGTWAPLATLVLGHPIAKFTQPATADGRLFVGTRDGHVLAYGSNSTSPLTAPSTDFGQVALGSSLSTTVTVTARTPVTITSAAAAAPFSTGTPARQTFPLTLAAGASVAVPVSFTASAAGSASGPLTLTLSNGSTALFSLRGVGTQDGFAGLPTPLSFGQVALGQGVARGLTIMNTGASPATISSVRLTAADGTSPADPAYTFAGAAPVGYTLAPQGSVSVVIEVHPTAAREVDASLAVTGTTGSTPISQSIPLTAAGYRGTPDLGLAPGALDFGQIQPGGDVSRSFQVTNCGDGALEITKAAVPASPFTVATPLDEGQVIEPGTGNTYPDCGTAYTVIAARPLNAMPHVDVYSISAGPASGSADLPAGDSPQKLRLSVNTAPWSGSIVSRYGCITVSGAAPARGAAVVDGRCTGGSQSQFTRTSDGRYHLGAASSPWCLAVSGYARTRGSPVVLAGCASKVAVPGNQRWYMTSFGGLRDANSGLCLHTYRGGAAIGTRLVVDTCTTTMMTERWDTSALLPTRGLVSSGTGSLGRYCLSDRANARSSGTPMILAGCSFAAGQVMTHLGTELKVFGACLTAASRRAGAGIVLLQCTGAASQVWTTDPRTRRLYNPASKLCAAVGATASGTPVTLAACNAAKLGQVWTLPDS